MIEHYDPLRRGREFERHVFGDWIWSSDDFYQTRGLPGELDFERSIQEQIRLNWRRAELAREIGQDFYDPSDPRTGESQRICAAVRGYLRSQGHDPATLHLYVAIGWNSLDFWHHIDAFFFWDGVIVTVDLSTENKADFQADILLSTRDLNPRHLPAFGERVGKCLIARKNAAEKEPCEAG
jgi:hypothetical protein